MYNIQKNTKIYNKMFYWSGITRLIRLYKSSYVAFLIYFKS